MDTMKLLLGATVALLLGALAVSWQGMNNGIKNTSPDEVARLKREITELQAAQDLISIQKQRQQLQSSTPPAATPTDIEEMKSKLAANEAALKAIELEKAERDAQLAQDEEGLLEQRKLEGGDNELRRARLIANALLIGRVKEIVDDPQFGGFITISIDMPEQVQVDSEVSVRRKTGILCQFKVTDVTTEGAVAYPQPGFGKLSDIKPGDEIILTPL